MPSRGSMVAVLSAAALLAFAAPAHAEQLAAKDEPKVSDNLESQGKKCATERDKHDGVVVAVVKACQRFYTLDTAAETDDANDYGVFWLQSTIDPKPGWCVTSGSSDIVFPARLALISKAPDAEEAAKKSKRLKTTLSVDADGNASTPGSVSQNSTLYPDKQTPSVKRGEKVTKLRLKWSGSSGEKLAFVSGVQVAWSADEGPPQKTRFGLRKYSLVEKETC
jgi:hypothetical protein